MSGLVYWDAGETLTDIADGKGHSGGCVSGSSAQCKQFLFQFEIKDKGCFTAFILKGHTANDGDGLLSFDQ